ncbi:uncharacterized protein LOC141601690 [Silene latifolia]|uniref:uncharacterized protein LOC141601690 n=1 Tax=Silene latifolia TaxID=37657 RepID=UPI003D7858FE
MIFSSWNIRGLNDPLKQQEVLSFLLRNIVDCGAVLETHIKTASAPGIYKTMFGRYIKEDNYGAYYNGRIWVLWNPKTVMVSVLEYSSQFIHISLTCLVTNQKFLLTFVYAFNSAVDRLVLWEHLVRISSTMDGPWACMGDFNIILKEEERFGNTQAHYTEMQDLYTCLVSSSLFDHPATGCTYTWTNKRDASACWAKLDRVVVN